jgi:hypothetical protein
MTFRPAALGRAALAVVAFLALLLLYAVPAHATHVGYRVSNFCGGTNKSVRVQSVINGAWNTLYCGQSAYESGAVYFTSLTRVGTANGSTCWRAGTTLYLNDRVRYANVSTVSNC